MSERIELKTKDDISIIGDYYPAQSRAGVALLHMMPSDRKSWTAFAGKLKEAGFAAIAIDLRGHGESEGGPAGYRHFSDAGHQASRLDLEAAVAFLREKGMEELHLAGASIGANLVLEYAATHPRVRSLVLLSPGLNYRGIKTEPLMAQLPLDPAVFLVASEEDKESYQAVQTLSRRITLSEKRMLKVFKDAGHGTTIFERNPQFMDEAVSWMQQQGAHQ